MSSSQDSSNAFSVLMKKPLLKSAKDELASSLESKASQEVHCDKATENNACDQLKSSCTEIKTSVSNKAIDEVKSSRLSANTSSTKVNAFSRLMAPKGKNKSEMQDTSKVRSCKGYFVQ